MVAAARTSDVESNKRANGGSRSIHTFLSITGRPLKLLNNRDWGDSVAPRRAPLLGGGGGRSFPGTPQLLHGFADSGVSLSLPHHRTAKANY